MTTRDGIDRDATRAASGDAPVTAVPGGIGARALERALAGRSIRARVEGRGALAVVIPSPDAPAIDAATRLWMVQAAREAGFTHVALELVPDPADADAALSGRHPA